jgi:hypothetical protein
MQTTSSLDRASSASRACAHTRNAVRRPPSPSARALNCVTTAIDYIPGVLPALVRHLSSTAAARGAAPRGAAADARASRPRPYRTLTPLPPACQRRPPSPSPYLIHVHASESHTSVSQDPVPVEAVAPSPALIPDGDRAAAT